VVPPCGISSRALGRAWPVNGAADVQREAPNGRAADGVVEVMF
jgi:hypothetical protein